jgi:hypothetical protein
MARKRLIGAKRLAPPPCGDPWQPALSDQPNGAAVTAREPDLERPIRRDLELRVAVELGPLRMDDRPREVLRIQVQQHDDPFPSPHGGRI